MLPTLCPFVFLAPLCPFQARSMPSKSMVLHLRQFGTMLLRHVSSSFAPIDCASSSSYFSSSASSSSSSSRAVSFSSSFVPSLDEIKHKNAAQIEQLSVAITQFCANSFERNKELRIQTRSIIAELERTICAPKGHSRLVLVGSIASGMAFDGSFSDIDLTFVYCGLNKREQENFMHDFWNGQFCFVRPFVEAIADTLMNYCNSLPTKEFRMSEAPELITHTNLPLLVAKFDNGTCFDISFPRRDYQSLRNTLMVRYYVQADRRFLLLFHWLRVVFRQMGLKNSKNGLFSSYHLLQLVLHFLSRKELPDNVLPAFSDLPQAVRNELFTPDLSTLVQHLEQMPTSASQFWTSKCDKSVGELAVELVDYYARFDPWTTAISIQHGRTIEVFRQANANNERPALKVMDPFHQMSTTRSPFLGEALVIGFQVLREKMSSGQHLDTFPMLDGLAEQFGSYVRSHGFSWAPFLDKNYTPPTTITTKSATNIAELAQQQDEWENEADEQHAENGTKTTAATEGMPMPTAGEEDGAAQKEEEMKNGSGQQKSKQTMRE